MVQHIHITGIIFQVSFVFLPLYHAPRRPSRAAPGAEGNIGPKGGERGRTSLEFFGEN